MKGGGKVRNKKNKEAFNLELRKKLKLGTRTPFNVREAYKVIRTNIMFSLTQSTCRTIGVSSAIPGEGKTTTCTNLALSFAEMGKKVLIIDCDMRQPQVHNIFDLDNQIGISNVLGGMATLAEAIHELEEDQLSVITAGHIPPNPAELLVSDKMVGIIDELEKVYDYIFIDTPPINVVTDAVVLSPYLSGMVLVTRQNESRYREIEIALSRLTVAKTKVLGFIVTGKKVTEGTYGKCRSLGRKGKYSNYYNYGEAVTNG